MTIPRLMLNWLRRRIRRQRISPRIELIAGGFAILGPDDDRYQVQWASIARIAAYKRDLITTDEIMLAIEVADRRGVVLEVSEEWTGFADLFAPMEQQLGIAPAWYREIMLPAFHRGLRVLYERPDAGAAGGAADA